MGKKNPITRSVLLLGCAFVLATSGCDKRAAQAGPPAQQSRTAVTALGRVTPGRAAIAIAAQPGSRILQLAAKDGMTVHAGDVLAYLETYPLRVAERDA